ncbi:MAG: sensor histidine kinase [Spirochaetes bacterium]|nr:sensor histidine kinase [Spirochaetota bacterium]
MHATICDFIADCLQNSVEANSTHIKFLYEKKGNIISAIIEDNGKGMTKEQLEKVRDPFYTDGTKHVKRKVGLGIPFLLHSLNLSGGKFDIQSEKGVGTKVEFSFDTSNIDTPPEGDISFAVLQAMMFDGDYELEFVRTQSPELVSGNSSEGSLGGSGHDQYVIKRSELLDVLGDINSAESINLARQYFKSHEENLNKEAGNG